MTKPEPALGEVEEAATWTCARCEMTLSFGPEVEQPRLPTTWAREDGLLYCLSCRREMAGEAGLEGIEDDTPSERRLQIRTQARIAFEINRDPERSDNQIAKSCRTSALAVRRARARLGVEPARRV
jgi:hypothetical protein